MTGIRIIIATIVLLLMTGSGFCAGKEQARDGKTGIFLKAPPAELTSKIDKELAGISKKHPVSAKQTAEIKGLVKRFTPSPKASPEEQDAHRRYHRGRICAYGVSAIPVLAEIMLSEDDMIRVNSMHALDCLVVSVKRRTNEAREADPVLIPLMERCLLDVEPEVRRHAIGYLTVFGRYYRHDVPKEVRAALERAERDDPLLTNRQVAHLSRVKLGLTKHNPELVPGPLMTD